MNFSLRKQNALSHSRLLEILHYEPATGVFTWRVSLGTSKAGREAGSIMRLGYRFITVDSHHYAAHRLAWFYMTGHWSNVEIDHRNGDKKNNSWGNLREATRAENQRNIPRNRNSTTGVRGVSWRRDTSRWQARIDYGGKKIHLGFYATIEEAAAARRSAELEHFGEFAPAVVPLEQRKADTAAWFERAARKL